MLHYAFFQYRRTHAPQGQSKPLRPLGALTIPEPPHFSQAGSSEFAAGVEAPRVGSPFSLHIGPARSPMPRTRCRKRRTAAGFSPAPSLTKEAGIWQKNSRGEVMMEGNAAGQNVAQREKAPGHGRRPHTFPCLLRYPTGILSQEDSWSWFSSR